MQPRRLQKLRTQTQDLIRIEDNYKSCYSWGSPIKTLIGGIGLWPVAPEWYYMRTRVCEFEMHLPDIYKYCLLYTSDAADE